MKKENPVLVHEVRNKKLGLIGYLVIDSTINGCSCGCLRMLPDITVSEIAALAKNKTLKYGFLGIPHGGATAGIIADSVSREKRLKLIQCFGESLREFLTTRRFIPGVDMGTSKEDVEYLMKSAGLKSDMRGGDSAYYTALGVVASAEEIIAIGLSGATVAIEGFGKVGGWAAKLFSDAGAKVVAISTKSGAIYEPSGFDVNELLRIRDVVGDDVVKECRAKQIQRSDLLQLPVDILTPCAKAWTIGSKNAGKIKAKVICAGANIPVTTEAEKILFERGILFPPDFATNAGGALGSFMDYLGFSEKEIEDTIRRELTKKVVEILEISRERNVSPTSVGREIAEKRFYGTKRKAEEENMKNRMFEIAKRVFRKHLIPKVLVRPFARRYISSMLWND